MWSSTSETSLNRTRLHTLALLAGLVVWLAGMPLPSDAAKAKDGKVPARYGNDVRALVGDYYGSFGGDDPDGGQYGISHDDPGEIIARLGIDDSNRLTLEFFKIGEGDEEGVPRAGAPLDLLGRGCNSSIGPLLEIGVEKMSLESSEHTRLSALFALNNGRCRARVETTGDPTLRLELIRDAAGNEDTLLLSVLKTKTVKNQLYAETAEGWVKVTPKVTEGGTLYNPKLQYCYEDFDGNELCFERSKERKDLLIPVPLPGQAAVFYGWHTARTPKVKSERETTREYHRGEFRRIPPPSE